MSNPIEKETGAKKPKISNAEMRRARAQANQAAKAKYEALKEQLLEKEKENYQTVALLRTVDGEWWKMFDHSGAIYAFHLAPKLDKKKHVKFLEDKDYKHKAKHGVATIKDFAEFQTNMARLGVELKKKDNNLAIFRLPQKLSVKEMEGMLRTTQEKRERANKLIRPVAIMPNLHVEMMALNQIVVHTMRKLDPTVRAMIGDEMGRRTTKMLGDFLLVSNGWKDKEEYLSEVMRDLHKDNADLMVLSDLQLIDADKAYNMMVQIEKTKKVVMEESKKMKGEDEGNRKKKS